MKVFITGGSGFLGRFLQKALLEKGYEVIAPKSSSCDLTESRALEPFSDSSFTYIYHLAAWTQAGDFCLYHSGEQWLINQKIHTNLLSWWKEKQPKAKLITIGTSCSYDPSLPLEESYYLKGQPIESLFYYAMTKRMLLTGLKALQKQYGLSYLYLIPSTLYGPSYHEDGRQMHFIFDLVRKIILGKLYQEPVILWGDGSQVREVIHVQDFVHAMLALSSQVENTAINLGGGKGYSISEFAQMICQEVGYPFEKIQFDKTRYVGAKAKVLQVEKMEQYLPHFSMTPLPQGIQQLIKWFYQKEYFIKKAYEARI